MNVAFLIISAISVVLMIARAPEAAFPTMIDGVTHAIELSIKLCAIYAVWLSVLKMVEATSLDKKLSKLLRPIVRKIFKNESDEAYDYISINLAANMFGMGGVATPAGAIMCKVLSLKKSDFNKTNKTSTLFTTKEKIKPSFCGYSKKSRRGAK